MSSPGWYPDPSGRPGQLRWWDGRAWTTSLRPVDGPVRRARTGRVLLAVLVGLVALVVVVVLVVQRAGDGGGAGGPGGPSTSDVCVTPDQSASPPPQDTPGRVTSGRMSVPALGRGWTLQPDTRVPFGRGMMRQQISVDDSPPWIVSLNVGTMVSGDGFFSPEQGVHVVMPCLIGEYYFGQDVQRDDVRDEALTVDGRPGWVLETELTFDIEGLDFTSERLVLVVVDLDDGTAGAVVVDLPASAADREPELRAALDDIRVS